MRQSVILSALLCAFAGQAMAEAACELTTSELSKNVELRPQTQQEEQQRIPLQLTYRCQSAQTIQLMVNSNQMKLPNEADYALLAGLRYKLFLIDARGDISSQALRLAPLDAPTEITNEIILGSRYQLVEPDGGLARASIVHLVVDMTVTGKYNDFDGAERELALEFQFTPTQAAEAPSELPPAEGFNF